MSKIIVDKIVANPGQRLDLEGDVNIKGSLSEQVNSVSLIGDGTEGETAVLDYGINLIDSGDINNYAAKLPTQAKLGSSVTIINNSNVSMVIYPSTNEGSIDGKKNGGFIIPADKRPYNFTCSSIGQGAIWVGPGSPSIGFYDSGDIIFNATTAKAGINNWISASDPSRWVESGDHAEEWSVADDGLNKPFFQINPGLLSSTTAWVYWKPSYPWTQIKKVTVFTNMTQFTNQRFGISFGACSNYYTAYCTNSSCLRVGNNLQSGIMGQPQYVTLSNQIAGTPTTTGTTTGSTSGFTLTTGEPGTYYGELIYGNTTRPSLIGDYFHGTSDFGFGIGLLDLWKTTYINTAIQPRFIGNGIKFRFIIEYISINNYAL